jgi:serine/threonine protein kinase
MLLLFQMGSCMSTNITPYTKKHILRTADMYTVQTPPLYASMLHHLQDNKTNVKLVCKCITLRSHIDLMYRNEFEWYKKLGHQSHLPHLYDAFITHRHLHIVYYMAHYGKDLFCFLEKHGRQTDIVVYNFLMHSIYTLSCVLDSGGYVIIQPETIWVNDSLDDFYFVDVRMGSTSTGYARIPSLDSSCNSSYGSLAAVNTAFTHHIDQSTLYQAPECTSNILDVYSEKCAVWSLGVIIHIISTGLHPCMNKSGTTSLCSSLSPFLHKLISGMLDIDPQHRLSFHDILKAIKERKQLRSHSEPAPKASKFSNILQAINTEKQQYINKIKPLKKKSKLLYDSLHRSNVKYPILEVVVERFYTRKPSAI